MVTVHVMRRLLDVGVDRRIVARVGEALPAWPDQGPLLPFRGLAAVDPAMWCVLVTVPEWAAELDEIVRLWPEDRFTVEWLAEFESSGQDELVWLSDSSEEPFAVALPITKYSAEYTEEADRWRRQRRIAEKHWPPWM